MLGQEMRSGSTSSYNQTNYGYLPEKGHIFVNLPEYRTEGSGNAMVVYTNPYLKNQPKLTRTKSNNISFYTALSYMYDNRYAVNLDLKEKRFGIAASDLGLVGKKSYSISFWLKIIYRLGICERNG